MARECFCGCGRRIGRQHKTINKRGAEIKFLIGAVERHFLPVQEAYVIFTEQHSADPEEIQHAREGIASGRETVEYAGKVQDQIATAIHMDDPSQVVPENLKLMVELLKKQDVHIRTMCLNLGLKYGDIPSLGPEGIVEFVEKQDRKDRARLRLQ